jgi:hypothetical protein
LTSLRHLPDAEFELALAVIGRNIEFPELPDLSGLVGREVAQAPGRLRVPRRWLSPVIRPVWQPAWQRVAVALVAMVAVLSGALAISPGARHAVAGWLGLRGVKIVQVPSPTSLPTGVGTNLMLGSPVPFAQAQAEVGFQILVPTALGPLNEVYFSGRFVDGKVTLLYRARAGLPEAETTGVGLLLTEFRAGIDQEHLEKMLGPDTTIESVTVNGEQGFWIAGAPHIELLFDLNGEIVPDSLRLAGNVLVWERGDLTLRIESALSKEQAIAIAESVG